MTNPKALAKLFEKSDALFFVGHPTRMSHIRKPYIGEHEAEFQTLGYHEFNRRRILLTRVDFERKFLPDNKLLKIPFLLNADETVEDTDDVLLPIIEEVMRTEVGGVQ